MRRTQHYIVTYSALLTLFLSADQQLARADLSSAQHISLETQSAVNWPWPCLLSDTASLRVTKINEEEYRCNCCVIFWSGPCCAVLTKQSVSLLTTALLSDWPAQAGTNQYSRLSDFMILCQAFLSCAASGCLSTEHIIVARFYIRFPPNKVITAEWQRGKFCCKWECWLDTIVGVSGCFLSGCTFTTSPDTATPFSMTISLLISTSTLS